MVKRKTWNEYYKINRNRVSNLLLHWQYLWEVYRLRPKSMLEIGCGPATHSLFLKKILKGLDLYLLDKDEEIIKRVVKDNPKIIKKTFHVDVFCEKKLKKLNIPTVDVIISQGLMEHFNDEKFLKVIENFRGETKRIIFSVHSDQYPNNDYGDEKLRSKEEIERLLNKTERINFTIRKYLDIGLKTKLFGMKKKDLCLSSKLSYLFFASNHLLVKIVFC